MRGGEVVELCALADSFEGPMIVFFPKVLFNTFLWFNICLTDRHKGFSIALNYGEKKISKTPKVELDGLLLTVTMQ